MKKDDCKRIRKLVTDYYRGEVPDELGDTIRGCWLSDKEHQEEKDTVVAELFFKEVRAAKTPDQNTIDSLQEIRELFGFPQTSKPKLSLARRLVRISAAAAAVLIMAGGGWLLFQQRESSAPQSQVAQVEIAAEADEQQIALPDGSVIDLKSGSQCRYSENFTEDRTVWLEGEGYFKVARLDGKTFTVRSSSITVTVRGTEFHMRAHSEHPTSEVKLASGSVEVSAEGIENVMLTPGQHFTYHRSYKRVELAEIGEKELARMRGININFEDNTLDEVFHTLSLYYDKRVEVEEGIDTKRLIVVRFTGDETADEVLATLKIMTGEIFNYRIDGDTIKITKPK